MCSEFLNNFAKSGEILNKKQVKVESQDESDGEGSPENELFCAQIIQNLIDGKGGANSDNNYEDKVKRSQLVRMENQQSRQIQQQQQQGENRIRNYGDRNAAFDDDFKLEYMDLEEFLTENELPIEGVFNEQEQQQRQMQFQQIPPALYPQNKQTNNNFLEMQNSVHSSLTTPQSTSNSSSSNSSPNSSQNCFKPQPQLQPQPKSHQQTGKFLSDQQFSEFGSIKIPLRQSASYGSTCSISGQSTPNAPSSASDLNSSFSDNKFFSNSDLSKTMVAATKQALDTCFNNRALNMATSGDKSEMIPVLRKRRKQMVSEEFKDDKYWERRRKNNMAAKRSRDARRAKETQIAYRASVLESENIKLKEELKKAKAENHMLKDRLRQYEVV